METRNNQTVAFTGHRKERILQGFGNDPRILAQIRVSIAAIELRPDSLLFIGRDADAII